MKDKDKNEIGDGIERLQDEREEFED